MDEQTRTPALFANAMLRSTSMVKGALVPAQFDDVNVQEANAPGPTLGAVVPVRPHTSILAFVR